MYIHDLSPAKGATHANKRKGRGHGTGTVKPLGAGTRGRIPEAEAAPE